MTLHAVICVITYQLKNDRFTFPQLPMETQQETLQRVTSTKNVNCQCETGHSMSLSSLANAVIDLI